MGIMAPQRSAPAEEAGEAHDPDRSLGSGQGAESRSGRGGLRLSGASQIEAA